MRWFDRFNVLCFIQILHREIKNNSETNEIYSVMLCCHILI